MNQTWNILQSDMNVSHQCNFGTINTRYYVPHWLPNCGGDNNNWYPYSFIQFYNDLSFSPILASYARNRDTQKQGTEVRKYREHVYINAGNKDSQTQWKGYETQWDRDTKINGTWIHKHRDAKTQGKESFWVPLGKNDEAWFWNVGAFVEFVT